MKTLTVLFSLVLLTGCSSTYKRTTIEDSIKAVAKKEYKLDVDVKAAGDTVTVRFPVKNLTGEFLAPDQLVWNNIDNIMVVLSRVVLSTDHPPMFIVLDVVDADSGTFHLIFTRCVTDIRKLMAEAQSRTEYQDRLLMEIEINGVRRPIVMDPVWLMMMASEATDEKNTAFEAPEVHFPSFLAKVSANTIKRVLQEKEKKDDHFLLRDVVGVYLAEAGMPGAFRIQLDLVSKPTNPMPTDWLTSKLMPMAVKEVEIILKSYKFDAFSQIAVVERNSGKMLAVHKS